MPPLTAEDVEQAFIETTREQQNGESFDWARVALHLNERMADRLVGNSRFLLSAPRRAERGK